MVSERQRAAAERAARVKALFEQGLNDDEIAAKIGTDRCAVRATRSRLGLLLPPEEVTRRKSEAAKRGHAEFRGSVVPDGPLRAPDVSHLYQGRRYDRGWTMDDARPEAISGERLATVAGGLLPAALPEPHGQEAQGRHEGAAPPAGDGGAASLGDHLRHRGGLIDAGHLAHAGDQEPEPRNARRFLGP